MNVSKCLVFQGWSFPLLLRLWTLTIPIEYAHSEIPAFSWNGY